MEDLNIPEIDVVSEQDRLSALEIEMQSPETIADYELAAKVQAKFKHQENILNAAKQLTSALQQYEEAKQLLNDPELAELAQADIDTLEVNIPKYLDEYRNLTLPELPNDENNAILEFRAGTGGTEASLFAEEVMRMYIRYVNSAGFKAESLSTSYNEEGGIKEGIILVKGHGAYGHLRFEAGVHRVQRVPATESSGRIHTSAISVAVLPELEAKQINIDPSDLKIDVYRSSGPGGQSVNTTDSAVRVTHIPTGITVSCQDGKSQHQNKDKAIMILASKLDSIQQEEQAEAESALRRAAIRSGDRSAKIRTYNFPQGRVTDHRISKSWFNITQILEGELSEIVATVNLQIRMDIAEDDK